jgi:hypothetical protein
MSKDLITLDENDDIHQALDKFKYNNLMSLPVIQRIIILWGHWLYMMWWNGLNARQIRELHGASGQTNYESQSGNGDAVTTYSGFGALFCGKIV